MLFCGYKWELTPCGDILIFDAESRTADLTLDKFNWEVGDYFVASETEIGQPMLRRVDKRVDFDSNEQLKFDF